MLALMEGKTRVYSVRVPLDLDARLQRIRIEQAHIKLSVSGFLLEAVKLYVDHAERFGIDDNLVVREPIEPYQRKPLKKTAR